MNYGTNKQWRKQLFPKHAQTAFSFECFHCWKRNRMVPFLPVMIEKPDEKVK